MNDNKLFAEFFSIFMLLIVLAVMAIAFSRNEAEEIFALQGWGGLVVSCLKYYLVFIIGRVVFHLVFSFANIVFRPVVSRPKTYPLVSILVPCYNEEMVLEEAVKSLLLLDYPNFEVLIIDDGSTDGTLEVANKLSERLRTRVIHQFNAGKASALNRGISEAAGEYVLAMDADSSLDSQVLNLGIAHMERQPKLGAVAGNLKVGNRGGALLSFQKLEYISGLNFMKEAQSFLKSVLIVPGPIGLFRKAALNEVGGYRLETYAEDADLTIRLLVANYQIIYEPRMIAYTEAPTKFSALIAQRYRWARGTLQSIKLNAKWLFSPATSFRNFFLMSYVTAETVVIPVCNFLFALAAIHYSLAEGNALVVGYLFYQLTILDLVLATYVVSQERGEMQLVAYAFVNRMTYALAMETFRFFAVLDEILGMPMKWNKLKREGMNLK